jgi:hypothetical protein
VGVPPGGGGGDWRDFRGEFFCQISEPVLHVS